MGVYSSARKFHWSTGPLDLSLDLSLAITYNQSEQLSSIPPAEQLSTLRRTKVVSEIKTRDDDDWYIRFNQGIVLNHSMDSGLMIYNLWSICNINTITIKAPDSLHWSKEKNRFGDSKKWKCLDDTRGVITFGISFQSSGISLECLESQESLPSLGIESNWNL